MSCQLRCTAAEVACTAGTWPAQQWLAALPRRMGAAAQGPPTCSEGTLRPSTWRSMPDSWRLKRGPSVILTPRYTQVPAGCGMWGQAGRAGAGAGRQAGRAGAGAGGAHCGAGQGRPARRRCNTVDQLLEGTATRTASLPACQDAPLPHSHRMAVRWWQSGCACITHSCGRWGHGGQQAGRQISGVFAAAGRRRYAPLPGHN
jgi:hypothetical protein